MRRRIAYFLIWVGLLIPVLLTLRDFVRLVALQAQDTDSAKMNQAASDTFSWVMLYWGVGAPVLLIGVGMLVYERVRARRLSREHKGAG